MTLAYKKYIWTCKEY